ncbi:MAG: DUF2878 domain-containing protein [Desulfobacterales bacterium]|jgi:hypothetical protein|nr:DUF2878 domain-containing protein [Desulfobacterales bacterium]
MRKVVDFIAFQTIWVACVWGAGKGYGWLGPATLGAWLPAYLFLSKRRKEEALLAAVCGMIGFGVDTLHTLLGIFMPARFILPDPFCPLWLLALWINMAPLINSSLSWLHGRYFLALLFGALGGPLAYWSGMRLGAISFGQQQPFGLLVLACSWAAMFPLLLWVSNRLRSVGVVSTLKNTACLLVSPQRGGVKNYLRNWYIIING